MNNFNLNFAYIFTFYNLENVLLQILLLIVRTFSRNSLPSEQVCDHKVNFYHVDDSHKKTIDYKK